MASVTLTQEDIDKLAQSMSPKTKAEAIKKVGYYYNDTVLTDEEKKVAEDIFRLMVRDVELQVRSVLADSIKVSDKLPKDIIDNIINDSDKIALPFIREASSLTHDDLVNILNSQNIERQIAVAERETLPVELSEYIAEHSSEDVVEALLENKNSKISPEAYNIIVEKFSKSENIKDKLLDRKSLPVAVIERIVNSLSDILQEKLLATQNVSENLVSDVVEQIKDRLTLKISQEYSSDAQIVSLIEELYKLNRLTPTLVVRSICMGDLKFFEYAISYLTKKNIIEVRKVLASTKDEFMIRNLLREANIPNKLSPAVIIALKIIFELNFDLESENKENFTQKVIERVLTFDSINEKMDSKDIEYLISKIS